MRITLVLLHYRNRHYGNEHYDKCENENDFL